MIISYAGQSIITVSESDVSPDRFADRVAYAHHVLDHFVSRGGSMWGCDGVGYNIQRDAGQVRVNKSGIGLKMYRNGLAVVRACETCRGEGIT